MLMSIAQSRRLLRTAKSYHFAFASSVHSFALAEANADRTGIPRLTCMYLGTIAVRYIRTSQSGACEQCGTRLRFSTQTSTQTSYMRVLLPRFLSF
jgi:hypothetical protein